MHDQNTKRLISIQELADYLRIGKTTAYNLAKTGAIPSLKCGRILRFELSEVLKSLQQNGNRNQRSLKSYQDIERLMK